MYPIIRFAKEMLRARLLPPLGLHDTHVTHHICWPWDLDVFWELNNGRTLTLFDLGRVPLYMRNGTIASMLKLKYRVTVAGSSIRYQRRITAFQRFEMRSRFLGWDDRFFYTEQVMVRGGQVTTQVLVRSALVGPKGLVAPQELADFRGKGEVSPPLPEWVTAWSEADGKRPWPPELGAS